MPPPVPPRAVLSTAPLSENGMASLLTRFGALRVGRDGAAGASGRCCHARQYHSQQQQPRERRQQQQQQQQQQKHGLQSARLAAASPLSRAPAAASFSTAAARPSRHARRHAMRMYFAKDPDGQLFYPPKASEGVSPDYYREFRAPRAPFPKNQSFKAQSVLGEGPRELVWRKVVVEGESIKAVAAELSIDMRRVAAVVRLKEIEKQWMAEGKRLATPYAKAMMAMLATNNYRDVRDMTPHEPINEIHMHKYTQQQLFVPVSESRHFTREDAARAFHPTILSADKRVPVPELIDLERDLLQSSPPESFAAFRATVDAQAAAQRRREAAAAADEQARTKRVDTGRFEFRIRDYNAEAVGKRGRSAQAVGHRYGMPSRDNKRGEVKIPTSVG